MSVPATSAAVPLLSAVDLTVSFASARRGRILAVDGVSVRLHSGEAVGLVGESGSGKTTVARAIAGLLVPDSGEIELDGIPLRIATARPRRAIQLVFQDPYASLNPRRTVRVSCGNFCACTAGIGSRRSRRAASQLMALVGLPAGCA